MNPQEIARVHATMVAPPSNRPAPTRLAVLSPGGANHGGACVVCNGRLEFWYTVKACNRCLGVKVQ